MTPRAGLPRAAVPDGAAMAPGEAVAGGWGARPGLAGMPPLRRAWGIPPRQERGCNQKQ